MAAVTSRPAERAEVEVEAAGVVAAEVHDDDDHDQDDRQAGELAQDALAEAPPLAPDGMRPEEA